MNWFNILLDGELLFVTNTWSIHNDDDDEYDDDDDNNNNNIQGDQKVSLHLMITIQKFTTMFKVSRSSLQTFNDTPNCFLEDCVQYSTVHIPNAICDSHLQIINWVGIIRIH
jgi:hypothetical protein